MLWVMIMKPRIGDQDGKEGDLKVCHVWKLLDDPLPGYAAEDDRLVMTTEHKAFRHFPCLQCRHWKWHWLRLSWVFVSRYLCSTVSFHYIMPSLMFRFLVPLLGYSTQVWVSILSLIFQLRVRPGSSEAQTASIVSICTAQWWSHWLLHARLRSSVLARLHQLRSCC